MFASERRRSSSINEPQFPSKRDRMDIEEREEKPFLLVLSELQIK